MATISKSQLKDVFKGISSVLFQKETIFKDLSSASEFSTSSTYSVGDLVTYNDKYYQCTAAVTEAGAWSEASWTEVVQGDASNIALSPDYDLPVHLDDLTLEEGDPTVNHYKIFGQDADWVATATKGDFSIKMVVPTSHKEVLKLAYGDDAVVEAGATNGGVSYQGVGLTVTKHEVRGTVVLINEAYDKMLIISNAVLWASLKFSDASTTPVAVQFDGTFEATGNPDILFLKKV